MGLFQTGLKPRHGAVFLLISVCFMYGSPNALAQGFSVLVSPPRFELTAKPGETVRKVVQIENVSNQAAPLEVSSADWFFNSQAQIQFQDALLKNSCRPWLEIESRQLTLSANGKYRYRFQVAVPKDAQAGECRFALMFAGAPKDVTGALPIPVSGRIAVIVYVTIGNAAPELNLVSVKVAKLQGQMLPVLTVTNNGNAHGRLGGYVNATEGNGHSLALQPESLPILPGETRQIALLPVADNANSPPPHIHWPLTMSGSLDAGAQSLRIDEVLKP